MLPRTPTGRVLLFPSMYNPQRPDPCYSFRCDAYGIGSGGQVRNIERECRCIGAVPFNYFMAHNAAQRIKEIRFGILMNREELSYTHTTHHPPLCFSMNNNPEKKSRMITSIPLHTRIRLHTNQGDILNAWRIITRPRKHNHSINQSSQNESTIFQITESDFRPVLPRLHGRTFVEPRQSAVIDRGFPSCIRRPSIDACNMRALLPHNTTR